MLDGSTKCFKFSLLQAVLFFLGAPYLGNGALFRCFIFYADPRKKGNKGIKRKKKEEESKKKREEEEECMGKRRMKEEEEKGGGEEKKKGPRPIR